MNCLGVCSHDRKIRYEFSLCSGFFWTQIGHISMELSESDVIPRRRSDVTIFFFSPTSLISNPCHVQHVFPLKTMGSGFQRDS